MARLSNLRFISFPYRETKCFCYTYGCILTVCMRLYILQARKKQKRAASADTPATLHNRIERYPIMPTTKITTLASRTPTAPDLAENVPFRKGSQSAHPKNSGTSHLAATVIEFPAAQFSERCGYKNPPRRRSNRATRTREHLSSGEIEMAAPAGRRCFCLHRLGR